MRHGPRIQKDKDDEPPKPWARRHPLATAVLGFFGLALVAGGLGNALHGPSTAHAEATVKALPARAAKPLHPGCASAIAALPDSPPGSEKQAADDLGALRGREGTTAGRMAGAVAGDSGSIGFDLARGKTVTADARQWKADAKALRTYCS